MSERRILYLSSHLSHPMNARRIGMLRDLGFEIEAAGFDRSKYGTDTSVDRFTTLGRLEDGAYWQRTTRFLASLPAIRRAIQRNDLAYVMAPDMAGVVLLARLATGKPVVLEVPDVPMMLGAPGMAGWLRRRVDQFIVGRFRLLVLTASEYQTYYRDWLGANTPSLVIENKPDAALAAGWRELPKQNPGVPLQDRPMRVGCFAGIRDRWSMELIEHAVTAFGDRFEFVIAGPVSSDFEGFDEFLARNPAVEYLGVFRRPDDLSGLYSDVDMSLACYDPAFPGGLSRSYRYYDSCAFKTPVIARADTGDALWVQHHQVGKVLHSSEASDAADELAGITSADWLRWRDSLEALQPQVYTFTDEPDRLAAALQELLED